VKGTRVKQLIFSFFNYNKLKRLEHNWVVQFLKGFDDNKILKNNEIC